MTILSGEEVGEGGTFRCEQCHCEVQVSQGRSVPKCANCGHDIFNDGRVDDKIH